MVHGQNNEYFCLPSCPGTDGPTWSTGEVAGHSVCVQRTSNQWLRRMHTTSKFPSSPPPPHPTHTHRDNRDLQVKLASLDHREQLAMM